MTVVHAREPAVANHGRVLGVDLGSRRIGVAVSDDAQRMATAVTVVARHRDDARTHDELSALVGEWEAVGIVIGLPLSMSGEVGPAASRALAETDALAQRLDIPVVTVDERMTTVSATAALRQGGRSGRRARAVVDQVAAAVLLQAWLDRRAAMGAVHDD